MRWPQGSRPLAPLAAGLILLLVLFASAVHAGSSGGLRGVGSLGRDAGSSDTASAHDRASADASREDLEYPDGSGYIPDGYGPGGDSDGAALPFRVGSALVLKTRDGSFCTASASKGDASQEALAVDKRSRDDEPVPESALTCSDIARPSIPNSLLVLSDRGTWQLTEGDAFSLQAAHGSRMGLSLALLGKGKGKPNSYCGIAGKGRRAGSTGDAAAAEGADASSEDDADTAAATDIARGKKHDEVDPHAVVCDKASSENSQFTATLRSSLHDDELVADEDDNEAAEEVAERGSGGDGNARLLLRNLGNGMYCRPHGPAGVLTCDRHKPTRRCVLEAGNQGWMAAQ